MGDLQVARGLGWFSIGLGLTQLAAPEWLGEQIGVGDHPALMRAMGVREITTGVGVLRQRNPAGGLRARVAGDTLDLALLASAWPNSDRRDRLAGAIGMVLGITMLDLIYAQRLDGRSV